MLSYDNSLDISDYFFELVYGENSKYKNDIFNSRGPFMTLS